MSFAGFQPGTFSFFADLSANNEEDWFAANEARYEEFVREPLRGLLRELTPAMTKLNPAFVLRDDIDDHISRLEIGETRAPGAAPYKSSAHVFFWNTELNRLTDATFFVGINAEGASLGFSIYAFGRNRRARMAQVFLPRLRTDLALLDQFIKSNYLRRGFEFRRFAKAPGRLGLREVDGFPDRATEWENTLGWVVSRLIHAESSRMTPGSFVGECQSTFERLYPLYLFASDPRLDWKRPFKKHI